MQELLIRRENREYPSRDTQASTFVAITIEVDAALPHQLMKSIANTRNYAMLNHDHIDRDERSPAPDSNNERENHNSAAVPQHHPQTWELKVQGVLLTFDRPIVSVREALVKAGFDPGKPWHIFLMVQGRKEEVSVDSQVDLSRPGLEKIRLMPCNVNNGDGQAPVTRRAFHLLDVDQLYLDQLDLRWETVINDQRRWLLIHNFPLPKGYQPSNVTLALEVPVGYPASQIDMFYFAPWVSREDGGVIPSIQVRANIDGLEYQGWSRHRNPSNPWDPATDNVVTHLALVDGCLAKELGQ